MRHAIAGLFIAAGLAAAPVLADDHPVVVELFTSQGCSACPPADALMRELSVREDVIALSLHVDYWDYIGWKDVFAQPGFTERQKAYARAAGHRTIYTPQIVVSGADHIVGSKPMKLAELIQRHGEQPVAVTLSMRRVGAEVEIRAEALAAVPDEMVLQIVRYTPSETVDITRGENAGKSVTYSNIVTEWRPVAVWNGTEALTVMVAAPGTAPVVALVQAPGHGAILAAQRLR